MKVCSKCKVEKDEIEFYKRKEAKDGLYSMCKFCDKERSKKYHINNIEKIREYQKEYKLNNAEKLKEYKKQYRLNNAEKLNECRRKNTINLSDNYIKQLISRNDFSQKTIPQDLVDFHREVIRAKRLLKELQK